MVPLGPVQASAQVDAKRGCKPHGPGGGHVQALAISRGKQAAALQRHRDRDAQLASEMVIAGAGVPKGAGLGRASRCWSERLPGVR